MVKLKGPSLAQDAAGGLGKTLIFSKSKGRSYVKRWAKPANPKTQGQQAMRAIVRFLSEEWRNLSSADQALWDASAERTRVSPFNAFQTFNITRWRNGQAPSQIPQTDNAGTFGSSGPPTVTAVSRGILFTHTMASVGNRWADLIFIVPTSGAPYTWDRLIHLTQTRSVGVTTWTYRPIPPGLYYTAISASKIHGEIWTGQWSNSVTVT